METEIKIRLANEGDLSRIVEMLTDDELGRNRERYEQPLPESYIKAFAAITSDPNNELVVACMGNEVIGVQEITFTPYITHSKVDGEPLLKVCERPLMYVGKE